MAALRSSSKTACADDLKYVFASLTSADLRTSHRMEQILETIYNQDSFRHHSNFVRRYARQLAATRSPSFSPDPSNLSSGVTTEADLTDDEVPTFAESPCYILSLDESARPYQPQVGWCFGTGDIDRFPDNAGVDMLIPPVEPELSQRSSSYSSNNFVYRRQGHFAFDPVYAQLWLHARHKGIQVDGRPLARRSSILLRNRSRISIGPHRYIFEFKIADEQEFQSAKRQYISQFLGATDPYESTSSTPSTNDVQIHNWRLHGVVGASHVSVIHAATNVHSGEVVAVKRLCFGTSRKTAEEEVRVYQEIRASISHHRYSLFVMRMHSVLENDRAGSSINEVYLLWRPLARGDFAGFGILGRWHTESEAVKRILFVQVLLGALAFHDSGWIHRDIKPANLGVVELGEKPSAIIMDEGQAVRNLREENRPRIRHCGTLGFIAPELENHAYAPFYDTKVDVWSMGAVAYFLFFGGRIPWSLQYNMFVPERNAKDPSLDVFRDIQNGLIAHPPFTFENLVGQMLHENPRLRPDTRKVLAHPALKRECEEVQRNIEKQISAGWKRSRDTGV